MDISKYVGHETIVRLHVMIRGLAEEYTCTECWSTQHPESVMSGTLKYNCEDNKSVNHLSIQWLYSKKFNKRFTASH